MDWLTFISEIFNSISGIIIAIAWPAAILVIFFCLRSELVRLFPYLQKLSYKDFVIEFGTELRKIAEQSKDAIPDKDSQSLGEDEDHSIRERLYLTSEVSPRAAILEAWLEVEHAAQRLIRSKGIDNRPLRLLGPAELRKYLIKVYGLTQDQIEIYEKLRQLRNRAVHFAIVELPPEEVTSYIDLALEFSRFLDSEAST